MMRSLLQGPCHLSKAMSCNKKQLMGPEKWFKNESKSIDKSLPEYLRVGRGLLNRQ